MLPRVAIPSYARSQILKQKTLKFLQTVGYPVSQILVFVACEAERLKYVSDIPRDMYSQIIVGLPGLKAQRRFITGWMSEDEVYVSIDDDIDGVKTLRLEFLDIIRMGVQKIETRRGGLFGILPKDDARCFKDDTTEHLSFVIGCLFVVRNHRDVLLEGACETDDYERSIVYYRRYGTVYRYRGAGVQTKYRGTSGGGEGVAARKRGAVDFLIDRYPEYCKYRDKRGMPDLLLMWRAKNMA